MPAAVLEVDGISKRYGDVLALRELSFTVQAGEVFGFVGGNGAGKTTTMRITLGVVAPDAGQVRWAGEPITLTARRRMGYLPEERGLYPRMRVLDQLVFLAELHGMPTNQAHSSAEYWLARLGLRDRRADRVQSLSLGNAQRVQLAAALVHDPEVLVLDEPFAGLDPVAVDLVSRLLRERAQAGASVIFSSPQLDLVERICDRIGIIQSGRMVACGTVAELSSGQVSTVLIDAPDAPPGWAEGVAGVTDSCLHNGHTLVRLAAGADDQAVLAAALATGPVRQFSRHRPSLAELYRDVVAAEEAP